MLKELENKLVEIVGKKEDYSLEDCLIAIDKISHKNRIKVFFKVLDEWTLNVPLQDQSDKTKDYIGDLLLTK